jgi:hypothetical protein
MIRRFSPTDADVLFLPPPGGWRWRGLHARAPRQIPGGQVNKHRPKNKNQANPESPIVMGKFPVGTRTMPAAFTTIKLRLLSTMIYFMHASI